MRENKFRHLLVCLSQNCCPVLALVAGVGAVAGTAMVLSPRVWCTLVRHWPCSTNAGEACVAVAHHLLKVEGERPSNVRHEWSEAIVGSFPLFLLATPRRLSVCL